MWLGFGFVPGLLLGLPGGLVTPLVSRRGGRAATAPGGVLGMVAGIVAWSALGGALTDMSATSPFVLGP